MKINCFKKRILFEDKVYLLIEDCIAVLETDMATFKHVCGNIVEIEDVGECIPEDEFNYLLREYFPESSAIEQVTAYETLEMKAKTIFKCYPLKRLFADDILIRQSSEYGMTIDEYIEKIDFPEELEREKARIETKKRISQKIGEYKSEIIKVRNSIPFENYGIELRHMAILENGCINFATYYVGDGIFYQTTPECIYDDIWEEAEIDENGTIKLPCVGGELFLSKDIKRDFRKYTFCENINYCLDAVPGKDEWTDYVELRKGGVSISISKIFLMKLINPRNFLNVYYFEGIPEIE